MTSANEIAGATGERIILDFEHLSGGRNCMTSSLWKMFHHMGLDISEEMLVGIASGLGFIYWNMKQLPVPFVGGMNGGKFPTILGLATDRLGGEWKVLRSSSIKRAHVHLKQTLKENIPALVCVDLGYLDYLSIGGDDHFGMHTVLVYGIDEIENEAYISDRFSTPFTISLSSLQKARASEYHPFPAKNKMLVVSMPERITPLQDIIPMAIHENAAIMLNGPISNIGIRGILHWKRELKKYSKLMPDLHNRVRALVEHFVYIETGGSGGALFRKMYSDFLSEAANIMEDSTLCNVSSDYLHIASKWSELAELLLPNDIPVLAEIRSILLSSNQKMEERGIAALDEVPRDTLRLGNLYKAAEKEVTNFDSILEPVLPLLDELHSMETEVMTTLALWSKEF